MPVYEIKLQIESAEKPSMTEILHVLEKYMVGPKVKVLAQSEQVACPMCGEQAEVVTNYQPERKRWWEFWRWSRDVKYTLTSPHPCFAEAARNYAGPESPWHQEG